MRGAPGPDPLSQHPALTNRELVAYAIASTVGIDLLNFGFFTWQTGSVDEGATRAARSLPFLALAAVVVLLLARRQLRARQRIITELERSRLGAEHTRAQLDLIARGSRSLAASLDDEQDALRSLVGVVVPSFADWCAVDLVPGGEITRLAAAHAVPEVAATQPDILDRHPAWQVPIRRVLATGQTEIGWDTQPAPTDAEEAAYREFMAALGLRSWVTVPIRLQGLSVGAISCATGPDRRGLRPADRAAIEELSARTAIALERIALFRAAQQAGDEAVQRATQLRHLVEAALALQPQHSRREVGAVLLEQACRLLGARRGVVVVGHGDEQIAGSTGGAWGDEQDRLLAQAERAEVGMATLLTDPATGEVRALAARLGDLDGRPAGTLAVADKDGGAFSGDDESFLVLLAQVGSVALESARLYETVRAGEEHLRALVEAAPLAVLEFGIDAELRQANTAAREILGSAGDDAGRVGFHPETAGVLRRVVADTVGGSTVAGAEAVARRVDGTEVALSLFGAPLRDAAGTVEGVLVLAADVSGRRRLEEQLVRARRIEAVGQVAGGVAHDFNNLLTVILGHASLLDAMLPAGDIQRSDVAAISQAAERAAAITSQLLTISRGDLVSPEVFDPRDRLGRLHDMVRSLLPSPISLVVDVAPGEGLVRMSPVQFDQVVLNLVLNARDAMAGRGTLTVRLDQDADAVMMTVADTGAGMDTLTAARCFEAFFTTKGGTRGTGLGLATVHSVVTGAGGEVSVESEPGSGTTFSVRLPLVAGTVPVSEPEQPRAGTRGSGRILVVENEDGLRRLAVEVLRSAGYVVTPAAHGQAALEAVSREVPDLVVSDVVMPLMGGVELARRLGESHPEVPVLFMTGYVDEPSRDSLQGAEVLVKPFAIEDLVARVGDLLEASRRAAQGSKR